MPLIWFRFSGLVLKMGFSLTQLSSSVTWIRSIRLREEIFTPNVQMHMIGLLFLRQCQKLHVLVLSYIVEKAKLIIVNCFLQLWMPPFKPIENNRRPNCEHSFENSIYKMYPLTNYPTASWGLNKVRPGKVTVLLSGICLHPVSCVQLPVE